MFRSFGSAVHDMCICASTTFFDIKQGRGCRHIASVALIAGISFATPVDSRESIDDANARVAGERSHFAFYFCGVSAADVAKYKRTFRTTLYDTGNFEAAWTRGWNHEAREALQLRATQANNPSAYAARIEVDCARLKWQAKNALKTSK